MSIIILMITGLIAGLLAGLLGIGGGLVIVPVLVLALLKQSVSSADAIHIAIATSLASILLTAIGSIVSHHRRNAVLWSFILRYIPWIALGAWSASFTVAYLADLFDGQLLISLFVLFALLTAYKLWRSKGRPATSTQHEALSFKWPQDPGMGLLIGHLSAVFGIGGGSMNAPYFHWRGVRMPVAVGTAAACGYPLALGGVLGFIWQSLSISADIELLGAVYWPAALIIGFCGLLAAPFGARLAHRLPEQVLRKIFALLLILLAIRMLWQ